MKSNEWIKENRQTQDMISESWAQHVARVNDDNQTKKILWCPREEEDGKDDRGQGRTCDYYL